MKKVAFFTTYIPTPHYETELEIMQRHIDEGDEVYQIYCERDFKSCTYNPKNEEKFCNICISKRYKGLTKLTSNITKIGLSKFFKKDIPNNFRVHFNEFEELKNYKIDNLDIGMGVLSTLISYLRTPYFDLRDHQEYITNNLQSAYQTYFAVIELLQKNKFDWVYIFNGRFTIERAILRACEKVGQKYYTHERGCDKDHYEIFENTLPHSIIYNHKKMIDAWNNEKDEEKKMNIAHNFYLSRIDKSWKWRGLISALDNQQAKLLPENWDSQKYNIVIFNTSDNEFVAIGEEYKQNIFHNQLEGIKEIANFIKDLNDNSIQLHIRIHPFIADALCEKEVILQALYPFKDYLNIIPPESPIDSYEILFNCDKVIVFSSSMGIEATYHRKPSISLASSPYQYLDVVYLPKNREELWSMLLDKNLPPKNFENTLPYAYYYETIGTPFKYYQAESLFSGKFKGEMLYGINVKNLKKHLLKQNIKKIINTALGNPIFEIYV
jgi:hypothetical protein